jgi:hypothetical protein
MDLEDAGCRVKYLIRDRDGKYSAGFDRVLADAGPNQTTSQTPMYPVHSAGGRSR